MQTKTARLRGGLANETLPGRCSTGTSFLLALEPKLYESAARLATNCMPSAVSTFKTVPNAGSVSPRRDLYRPARSTFAFAAMAPFHGRVRGYRSLGWQKRNHR